MNTYILVNLIHNDFHAEDAIFAPFFEIGAQAQAAVKPGGMANGNGKLEANGDAFEELTHDIHAVAISSKA